MSSDAGATGARRRRPARWPCPHAASSASHGSRNAGSQSSGASRATRMVRAMLRVSATAWARRLMTRVISSAACIRSGTVRRGFSRPLWRASSSTCQARSMIVVEPVGLARSSASAASVAQPSWSSAAIVGQQLAEAIVDDVDVASGGPVAQRWPHQQVHQQAHRDPDPGVDQPVRQHPAVADVAGGEHDHGSRGRGHRRAQSGHGASQHSGQHGWPRVRGRRSPNSCHAPEAMSTPSTLAPACWAPRCSRSRTPWRGP